MLNLFKKDAKLDPAELEKLRQKLAEVTSQPIPVQQAQTQAAVAQQPAAQMPAPPTQQFTYVDPERAEENERITSLIMQQIRELIEIDSNLNTKIKEMESKLADNTNAVNNVKSTIESYKQKMEVIDKNMEKFMGLYEIVTNRFNPFIVEEEEVTVSPEAKQEQKGVTKDQKQEQINVQPLTPAIEQEKQVLIKTAVPAVEDSLSPAKEPGNDMSQYVDQLAKAMNAELKQSMSSLNANLSFQVKSAVKEQVESQYVKELIRSAVDQELDHKDPPVEEPKRQRKIPKQYQFHLSNGFFVDSTQSLIDGMKTLDDAAFSQYVDRTKNDFAQWIALALKDDPLAAQAAKLASRTEMIEFCEKNL